VQPKRNLHKEHYAMSTARTVAIAALVIVAAASFSRAGPTDFGDLIKPNTPEAAAALAQESREVELQGLGGVHRIHKAQW
jgi:hypothetical protein